MKRTAAILLIAWGIVVAGVNAGTPAPHLVSVTAGADHACALTDRGEAYCWGANESGQLGDGSAGSTAQLAPVRVQSDAKFAVVAAGFTHTCALERDQTKS